VPDCIFCDIAAHRLSAVTLYEDHLVLAFLDRCPIRRGHTQVITKQHVPTFDALAPEVGAHLLEIGQRLARRMKAVYDVQRVAFLFTGNDIAHVHAHVVPMHEATDITSARYITHPSELSWGATHLSMDEATRQTVKAELAFDGT